MGSQFQETTNDDIFVGGSFKVSRVHIPPLKELGEEEASEPRDREVHGGGCLTRAMALPGRLSPPGRLEVRIPVEAAHKMMCFLGLWGWCRQEKSGSKGANGKCPAQDILVTLGIQVMWL